jgi:hypothetical protein
MIVECVNIDDMIAVLHEGKLFIKKFSKINLFLANLFKQISEYPNISTKIFYNKYNNMNYLVI